MEPSLVLPVRPRRQRDKEPDFELCFFCQDRTLNEKSKGNKSANILCATEAGIKKVKECAIDRQKYHDEEFLDALDRLQVTDIENQKSRIKWHRICYSKFTNIDHIKRLKKKFEKKCCPISHKHKY